MSIFISRVCTGSSIQTLILLQYEVFCIQGSPHSIPFILTASCQEVVGRLNVHQRKRKVFKVIYWHALQLWTYLDITRRRHVWEHRCLNQMNRTLNRLFPASYLVSSHSVQLSPCLKNSQQMSGQTKISNRRDIEILEFLSLRANAYTVGQIQGEARGLVNCDEMMNQCAVKKTLWFL